MLRYPALVDGEEGAYGVVFPDLPGCVAMGHTVSEALLHAEEALRDYVAEMEKRGWEIAAPSAFADVNAPPGNILVLVPLVRRPAVAWLARRIAQLA